MNDEELSYEGVLARIAELVEQVTSTADPVLSERLTELLDWIDVFHREGLGRLIEMTRAWRGEIFLEAVAADEVTGTLLRAYGLGEGLGTADADAVAAALETVRPLVESHGGAIEVESIVDGVVRVRLLGTCDGCPSSSATLTYGVEAALREHWPHFRRLEVVEQTEVDPAKADLTCVTVADPVPEPEPVLLQIRGRGLR